MLLTMPTLRSLSGCKVPIGGEPDISVAFGHITEKCFALMYRFVGIFAFHGLNDELALDLEVDVVGGQRPLWLFLVLPRTHDSRLASNKRKCEW